MYIYNIKISKTNGKRKTYIGFSFESLRGDYSNSILNVIISSIKEIKGIKILSDIKK